jgi:hypothetical protein
VEVASLNNFLTLSRNFQRGCEMSSKSPVLALALAAVACFFFSNTRNYAQTQTPPTRQLQPAEPVASWPGKAKRWAPVIGVDQYADPQISPLKGAANDAKSWPIR